MIATRFQNLQQTARGGLIRRHSCGRHIGPVVALMLEWISEMDLSTCLGLGFYPLAGKPLVSSFRYAEVFLHSSNHLHDSLHVTHALGSCVTLIKVLCFSNAFCCCCCCTTCRELGYNHYAGRLGISMPETAALLARSWPEWQVRTTDCCCFCNHHYLLVETSSHSLLPVISYHVQHHKSCEVCYNLSSE